MREKSRTPRPVLRSIAYVAGMLAASMTFSQAEPATAAKKKIVFVAGNPSHPHGEHEHRAGCMLLADQLNKSGLPVDAVVTTNGWPKDNAIFDGASAVVIYSDGGDGHPAMKQLDEMKKLVSKGVGIGCIHYAVEIPAGEPGNVLLDSIGGFFESNWSVNPTWDASYKLPKHPVTRGINDFKGYDEWYYHMRFRPEMKGVTPILTDLPPPSTLTRPDGPHEGNPEVRAAVIERKEPQHTMWVYERPAAAGGGRGFGYCGGHYHKNWQQDDPRRLVLNAIVWISGLEVPKTGVPSKTPTDEEMTANLDKKG
ncbi:ThuA domain-containing protein [Luteolibacter sp.]|uniref:ThuA domain-containing protein n=1 Tax=Luteolibacter sp. TaxID=1962973 RepID=UPI003263BBCA